MHPIADENGYGIRVPGIAISPYAKQGYIDHQNLSFDAYLKCIEEIFLNGQRLDPKNDGRPDSRPDVRENSPILGDLMRDLRFSQPPRTPLILPPYPRSSSSSTITTLRSGIPSLPLESVVSGLMIGLLAVILLRRRQEKDTMRPS